MNFYKNLNNLFLYLLILLFVVLGLVGCGGIEIFTADAGPANNEEGSLDYGDVGTAATPPTSDDPAGLVAFIEVQESVQQGNGGPIMVKFLLKNNAEEPVYLLKWYTPLEGIAGNIFEVTRDGQEIPYIGILASRGAPTPESYVFLEPGEKVTAEVNIAEAYDFMQPGLYTIKFRSPLISHIARSEEEMATTLDELGPVNIPSNEVSLEVVAT